MQQYTIAVLTAFSGLLVDHSLYNVQSRTVYSSTYTNVKTAQNAMSKRIDEVLILLIMLREQQVLATRNLKYYTIDNHSSAMLSNRVRLL